MAETALLGLALSDNLYKQAEKGQERQCVRVRGRGCMGTVEREKERGRSSFSLWYAPESVKRAQHLARKRNIMRDQKIGERTHKILHTTATTYAAPKEVAYVAKARAFVFVASPRTAPKSLPRRETERHMRQQRGRPHLAHWQRFAAGLY